MPFAKSSAAAGAATGSPWIGLACTATGSPPSPITGQPSSLHRIGWRWTTRPRNPLSWKCRNQSVPSGVSSHAPWCGPFTDVEPCASTIRSSYGPNGSRDRNADCQPCATPPAGAKIQYQPSRL
nr:hypothetical protein [Glycomyces artemisiae]